MKTLVFLAVASLLLTPSVAAQPGPAPCATLDTECWWAWVEDNSPFPLCDHSWVPLMEEICFVLDPGT